MVKVHVAVGSNIEPEFHVQSGLNRLDAIAPIQASSRFYLTPAIDRPDQGDYWNGVIVVQTDADPETFRATLRQIESEEGRVRSEDKWAARELDLDVLLVEGAPVDEALDDIQSRPFLQWCLLDLAGRSHNEGVSAPYAWVQSASLKGPTKSR